jgi:hypothetical protein
MWTTSPVERLPDARSRDVRPAPCRTAPRRTPALTPRREAIPSDTSGEHHSVPHDQLTSPVSQLDVKPRPFKGQRGEAQFSRLAVSRLGVS